MGRLTVKVPDVGEGIAEVELVSWAVTEGQTVERNQIIAEVMTDKATVEVPSPVDGVVGGLNGGVGDTLLVGSQLFTLEIEGEDEEVEAQAAGAGADPPSAPAAPTPPPRPEPATVAPDTPEPAPPATAVSPAAPARSVASSNGAPRAEGRRPTATPAVRRRAREAGIDLRTVIGTGPAGRIGHEDLDAMFAGAERSRPGPRSSPAGPGRAPNATVEDQPIVGMRRRIAEQTVSSTTTIPHITYVEEIDVTALEELRATLNRQTGGGDAAEAPLRPKLTLLPFLIRALVNELPEFPSMNAHVVDPDGANGESRPPATLRTFGGVHVGIATQTDNGLVVPVLRHAESETVWSAAQRIGDLAAAARGGTADRTELTGSTITITSLGALGGLVTTPVINKPETTIIGVNKMVTRPVWTDGEFVPRKMMNLSSSFDHRVIDGWDAARFVQAVKRALEQPALLFVDRP
ncbi:MAG: dihydrolipoamide acetyltransferase family protein [Acidimicrobiales bacterium]